MDIKQQFELERHVIILSAPNYNLPTILRVVLKDLNRNNTHY